jgi:mono/diheme cytochrome c family protein
MLKKVLLIVLAVVVIIPAAGLAFLYVRKPAQAPAPSLKVPMTPARIARGKFLFEIVSDCGGCHSLREFKRFNGPEVASGRGQGTVLSAIIQGLPGTVVAPNITPDPETGIGAWTDGEKIRAIRDGVDKNGRALFPMMPYTQYRNMSDEDVESLVAYLDSLPAVRNPLPQTALNFPVNLMIKFAPKPAAGVPAPVHADRLQYGAYLVAIAGCVDCHSPLEKGRPVAGMDFAGGRRFASSFGTVVSANITPDAETGIGKWSEEFFLKKFYDYKGYVEHGSPVVSGPEQFTLMPWLGLAQLPPEDLGAIYTFLRTVKPIPHAVETHPKTSGGV